MIRLVHLSIALYVNCRHARMRCAKTDEPIVIWFGGGDSRGPKELYTRWGPDPVPREAALLSGGDAAVCQITVDVCWCGAQM